MKTVYDDQVIDRAAQAAFTASGGADWTRLDLLAMSSWRAMVKAAFESLTPFVQDLIESDGVTCTGPNLVCPQHGIVHSDGGDNEPQ